MYKAKFNYQQASFLTSAPDIKALPADSGIEVAFAGRSNAGKSSALNTLTRQNSLARTSKTPGRTQLINTFTFAENKRLIDLPGYGFAKVPLAVKEKWQKSLSQYLEKRQSLQGLVVLMDIRHPLKSLDEMILHYAIDREIPVHILLTKSDKLKQQAKIQTVRQVKLRYELVSHLVSVQAFSSLKKQGVEECHKVLEDWFQL